MTRRLGKKSETLNRASFPSVAPQQWTLRHRDRLGLHLLPTLHNAEGRFLHQRRTHCAATEARLGCGFPQVLRPPSGEPGKPALGRCLQLGLQHRLGAPSLSAETLLPRVLFRRDSETTVGEMKLSHRRRPEGPTVKLTARSPRLETRRISPLNL